MQYQNSPEKYSENHPENRAAAYQKGRRKSRGIFPIVAVLTAAGSIVGIFSLILSLADSIGGAPTPISTISGGDDRNIGEERPALTLEPGGSTLSASVTSPVSLPLSAVLGNHSAPVMSILAPEIINLSAARSPNASPIVTGSQDNTVRIWSADRNADARPPRTLTHNSAVNDVALVPPQIEADGLRLVTGSGSGEIKLWDFESGKLITTIADDVGRILSVAASVDGRYFASGSSNGSIKVWPVETIAAQKSQTNLRGQALKAIGPAVSAIAFHPTNPNWLISGDAEGTLHIWDIEREQITLTFASSPVPTSASSPDAASDAGLEAQSNTTITSLSLSPDGRYVASAMADTIQIWDIQTGRLTQTLSGHNAQVSDLAFSPDGIVLASSSHNQTVKTWNWASGTVFCTLDDEAGAIHSVAFAEGGDTLISGNEDGTVRSWDLGKDSNRACLGR